MPKIKNPRKNFKNLRNPIRSFQEKVTLATNCTRTLCVRIKMNDFKCQKPDYTKLVPGTKINDREIMKHNKNYYAFPIVLQAGCMSRAFALSPSTPPPISQPNLNNNNSASRTIKITLTDVIMAQKSIHSLEFDGGQEASLPTQQPIKAKRALIFVPINCLRHC